MHFLHGTSPLHISNIGQIISRMRTKVAVVTGATGGIGRAIIEELDKEGFTCVLIGKHEKELQTLQKSLKTRGSKYYICDFSKVNEVIEAGKEILKDFDTVDVLLNVAGIGVYKPIEEVTVKEWEDSYAIGNTSPYFLTKTLLPSLSKSDLSLVINIGSGMGVMPAGGRSVYSSMKFALRGQTLSLAKEFERSKPNFVLMTLGSVLTAFGPMSLEEKKNEMETGGKGYLTPEYVAKKILEVIKDKNREDEYTVYSADYAREWQKN